MRKLFKKDKSTGPGNADKLFEKYRSHLAKHDVDIMDIEDHEDSYSALGFNADDYNWVMVRVRTHHSFKYPDNMMLWQVYKEWYAENKDRKTQPSRPDWDRRFMELAVEFDPSNDGKAYNANYLRKKLQKLIDAALAMAVGQGKRGVTLPNPVSTSRMRRVSAEAAVGGDNLSWI